MNLNKKLFRICLLIVVLIVIPSIGITSASAAYNNNTIYVSTSGNNNHDGLSWNNSKASINNASDSVSNNGKIYIANGIYYEHNIKINKNTTIIGQSQENTIINAESTGNIFSISSGVILILKNITLINGNTNGNGGAIQNSGTCNVIGTNFYNNQVTGSNAVGGAIANDGGTLNVVDSTFNNNRAIHKGGAISNNKGKCVIKNCNFNSNSANLGSFWEGYGAAIYNDANCAIESSNFTGNTGFYGGAIYNGANCTLVESNFIDNTGFYGGAVYNGANCTLTKCSFLRNGADYSSIYNGNNYDTGGAIYNDANCQVTSSIFVNNTALKEGGAIYNAYKCTVNFCSIVGNTAKTGNTIYNYKTTGMSMDAINNWWGSSNGPSGIFGASNPTTWMTLSMQGTSNVNSSIKITANFTNDNQANYHDPVNGCLPDGIQVSFYSAYGSIPASAVTKDGIATVTFIPNIYSGEATCIVTVDRENFDFPLPYITNKNIYVSTNGNDITGDGSPIKPYQTIQKGISLLDIGGYLHIANGIYTGDGNTGINIYRNMAIIGQNPSNTIIDGMNTTQIFNIANGAEVTIENLKLINGNSKEYNGGAIHNEGTLTIKNCTFSGNTANNMGSALFNYGTCNITDSNFTRNYGYLGGAIYNSGKCIVKNTNFIGNTVTNNGGAILNDQNLTVTGSNFSNNTAKYYGGAIYNLSNLTAHFNRIVDNKALIANNIYNAAQADVEYNWWGSNNGTTDTYAITVNRWLILKINASPYLINGSTSVITADLRYDNKGTLHNEGYIPDGIMVIFKTTLGTINSSKTANGIAKSTLNMEIKSGVAAVSTTIDNETAQISVKKDTISPTVSVKPVGGIYNTNKTITLKMSETGTIYYTLNGITPTKTSSKYTGPITISKTTILKYLAVDLAGNKSPIYSQTYMIDKIAPQIKTTTPTNFKTGVSRTSNIVIKFSENVKSAIYFKEIKIKNSSGKTLNINKIKIKGSTIYITTTKRTANTWYQVMIPKSSIKDCAGNNLKLNYSFKFKTGK